MFELSNLSLVQVDLGEKPLSLVVVGILNHIKISPQKGKKGFWGYAQGVNFD